MQRDAANRLFAGTQRGVVHVFENHTDVEQTDVFLDIQEKTFYKDAEFAHFSEMKRILDREDPSYAD